MTQTIQSDTPQTYTYKGYESVDKRVGAGNDHSSRVNLPASWRGKRVRVICLDP